MEHFENLPVVPLPTEFDFHVLREIAPRTSYVCLHDDIHPHSRGGWTGTGRQIDSVKTGDLSLFDLDRFALSDPIAERRRGPWRQHSLDFLHPISRYQAHDMIHLPDHLLAGRVGIDGKEHQQKRRNRKPNSGSKCRLASCLNPTPQRRQREKKTTQRDLPGMLRNPGHMLSSSLGYSDLLGMVELPEQLKSRH
jgi:hypothetical protein